MSDSKAEISKEIVDSESRDSLFELCDDLRKRRTAMDAMLHFHEEQQQSDDVLAVKKRYGGGHSAKDHSYRGSYHNMRYEEETEFWDPRIDGDIRDETHQHARPDDDPKKLQRMPTRGSKQSGDSSKHSMDMINTDGYREVTTEQSPSPHHEHWQDVTETSSSRRSRSRRRIRSLSRPQSRGGPFVAMDDVITMRDSSGKSNDHPVDFHFSKNMATSPTNMFDDDEVAETRCHVKRPNGGTTQTRSLSQSHGGRADGRKLATLHDQRDDTFTRLEELLGLQPLEERDPSIVYHSVEGLSNTDSLHRGAYHNINHEKEKAKWRDIRTKYKVLEPGVDSDFPEGEDRTEKQIWKNTTSPKHRSQLSGFVPEPSSMGKIYRNALEEMKSEEKPSSNPQQSPEAVCSRSRSLRRHRSFVSPSPRGDEGSIQHDDQCALLERSGMNDGKGTSRDRLGKKHDISERDDVHVTPNIKSGKYEDDSKDFCGDKDTRKSTIEHGAAVAQRQLTTKRGSQPGSLSVSHGGEGDMNNKRLGHQIVPAHNRSLSKSRRRARGPPSRSSIREPDVKEVPPRQIQTKSLQDAAFGKTPSETDVTIVEADNQGTFRIVAYRAPRRLDGTNSEFIECGVRSVHPSSVLPDDPERNIRTTKDQSGVTTNVPSGNNENKEIRNDATRNAGKNEKFKALKGFFARRNLRGKHNNKSGTENGARSDGVANFAVGEGDNVESLQDQTTKYIVPESVIESDSVLNPEAVVMKATSQPVVIDSKQRLEEAASIMSTARTRLPISLPIPKGTRKSTSDLSLPPPGAASSRESHSPTANDDSENVEERDGMDPIGQGNRTPAILPFDIEHLVATWVASQFDALCGEAAHDDDGNDDRDVDSLGDIDYYEYSAARRRLEGFR